ncbi:640fcbc6-deb0-419d-8721-15944957a1c0 [Thermothielavioides terrestris]|uniref:640fcbc6-deb0-419d-8721-15944957a1c0 n=1 Tax=Thermothielavioides terrestris TaxID=2587410 RepID=A0A3S4AW55_9PEZI|nr:640fcbc6-deb0-419d-8721-15944957a1c0 [Thermothielavioides terrestris]
MNKNWNDKADKDLFFTILSVKNIGVISGSEWVTIGNHMRSLGYGFTNEGCRQHFQGLRRAQQKNENSAQNDNPRKIDPTLNPITRRPGPGRGRPRKQAAGATAAPPPELSLSVPSPPQFAAEPGVSAAPPVTVSPAPGAPGNPAMQSMPAAPGVPVAQGQPQPGAPVPSPRVAPQAQMTAPDGLAVDPSLVNEPAEEPAAKRQRLNDSQDPSLDDEAVLNALASHNNTPTPGEYSTEYSYGDA